MRVYTLNNRSWRVRPGLNILLAILIGVLVATNAFAGCGTPSFRSAVHVTTGNQPEDLVTGDFNRDGNLDLAVAIQADDVCFVLYGDGRGGFPNGFGFAAHDAPMGVSVGDFNRDGAPDLVVANFLSDDVSILLNTGSGLFGAPTNIAVGNQPQAIAIDDFNRDGKLDLAVNRMSGSSIGVLLGNGTGGFGASTTFALAPTVGNGRGIVSADVDFDGDLDLALLAANAMNQGVFVIMLNNGAGSFTFSTANNINVGLARDLATGDLNQDGRTDFVIGSSFNSSTTGGLTVLLGNGTGGVTFGGNLLTGDTVDGVTVGDVNGDGKPDVLGVMELGRKVVAFLGNGMGGASAGPFNFVIAQSSLGFMGLAAGDLNSDGRVDFMVSSLNLGDVSVGLGTCGGGTNRPKVDFDGDGTTDIAVFRPSSGSWFILKSSNSSFQAFQWGQNGDLPATGDFDGDGISDFAVFRPAG
ncbi:MAG: VCBS repeat-containing protein, partial [Pyrinomonadaceae bacterium]